MADFEPTVGNFEDVKFPFGKYRGKRLGEIPANYLNWAVKNMKQMSPRLREQVDAYLENPTQTSINSTHNALSEIVAILPLPDDNRIEVRIKRRIQKSELEKFRKVISLIEEFITEE